MSETWCGKDCAICKGKEALNCPGCKAGPGKLYDCSCDIAKCCWRKGHADCQTCQLRTSCSQYGQRYQMAGIRLASLQAETQAKQDANQRAAHMVKWFRFLFWLVIPNIIASILTIDSFQETAPGIYLLGGILTAVSTLAYGIVLQHLREANAKYFTAGCCKIVVGGLSLLKVLVLGSIPPLNVAASLISAIVSVCAVHEEYTAHSEALRGVDDDLADKWLILWKAYIILLACTLGSIVLAIFVPILAVLALLVGSIGLVIVNIIALVSLYSSAKALRFYNTYFVESL